MISYAHSTNEKAFTNGWQDMVILSRMSGRTLNVLEAEDSTLTVGKYGLDNHTKV